jgi:DNA repair exonuclease SbcCD nuclease subunit
MKIRWIHTADVHLGYQQYGKQERADDFARAFKHVCDHAISSRVDFLLIAGDLFHKRAVDARTMMQAFELLNRLRDARIPVLCVEGNHERAFYNSGWTWLEFLAVNGLLYLLAPDHSAGQSRLEPWDEENRLGGYVDLGPARVYGIKYHGASAPRVLEHVSEQLSSEGPRPFSVMMLHEGMEGQIPRSTGGLSGTQIEMLRPHCEYLALGHIHKQYEFGAWAYNPGSLETCSTEECDWTRGYYEVEADTESRRLLSVRHHENPRRQFHRLFVGIEACTTPQRLEDTVLRQVERKLEAVRAPRPVVDVTLRGTLQFGDDGLDLERLEARVRENWDPLVVRIKNNTVPVGYSASAAIGEDGTIDRRALELQVLTDLLLRDARYASAASEWAHTFQELKDSALAGLPPEDVVTLLERGLERAGAAGRTDDAA